MSIPLAEVLRHPALGPARPVLIAGDASRPVRWVHSSEVVELAHLLRGGELVLTAAMVLTAASDDQQRRYVAELVEHDVTAVAVEHPGQLPAALVDEARKRDFALVQLRRTVPFVEVTEAINGVLIHASVARLRLADSLSDQLSEQLLSGGDVHALVDSLARRLNARVSVQDPAGSILAATEADASPASEVAVRSRETPIAVHGVVAATLRIQPLPSTDPDLLDAALDRAPSSLALTLQRSHLVGPDEAAAHAFFEALERPDTTPATLTDLIGSTSLSEACGYLAVVSTDEQLGWVEHALRHRGRLAVSRVRAHEHLSVVAVPGDSPERARDLLIEDVGAHTSSLEGSVVIGPLVRNPHRIRHSVAEARRCLLLRPRPRTHVIDATEFAVRRLVHRLDAQDVLHDFVAEQLGGLLEQRGDTARRLLETLVAYLDCDANRTATANRLHLQRQTLYHRLDQISRALGREITDERTAAGLQVAVRLWQAMEPDPARWSGVTSNDAGSGERQILGE
ncbi:PucR family transcriptional regulator ligand-binding domain-containing protein [Saccharopolyspora sp. TS4A08]|uniref:PucR family transcriptional regulator ligand-binding domain-containing protein n=1 Tax=Saccharopolyspora ipomoeae TaxID=3042027 RepID=A0ABT6PQK1_9PSEU|nr:PucR family transcriptional regulator [Saccharopolyspora sp. TS4A08]MDI2030238.1 PucR family transcriptional regulator ligand-binding domain-containing protein [Saccharopolyspora sp. TS4A08]